MPKILSNLFKEELLVPLIAVVAMIIAFSPFVYEEIVVYQKLSETRYPLIETEFPPDMRVYLSRMREGYEGQWLVMEKYTSEVHKPSILHISYLLMGKATGILRIDPVTAFPIWRLIFGFFMLFSGYFFISEFLKDKKLRITAFLLFVVAGNLPVFAKNGVSLNLGWFTFLDPVKRLVYLPHYTLSAGLLALTMVYLWRGVNHLKRSDFIKAGFWGFLATIVLPQSAMMIVLTVLFLIPYLLVQKQDKTKLLKTVWPLVLFGILSLVLIGYSLSYFPWSVQSQADLTKRYMGFDPIAVILGLGSTAILGLAGIFWIMVRRLKIGYLSVVWFLSSITLVILFTVFPYSNSYRPLQVDLHLPLAVISVVLLNDIVSRYFNRKSAVFLLFVFLAIVPSFWVWRVSLGNQISFVNAKIGAGYPLIPQLPYVVYPIKPVMDSLFWLKNNTSHDAVILAAETLGSMIPAYSGNFVYLGHGNQTVYFDEKMALMKKYYRGEMTLKERDEFLKRNRIDYVYWGIEEKEIAGKTFTDGLLKPVYNNGVVVIYKAHE